MFKTIIKSIGLAALSATMLGIWLPRPAQATILLKPSGQNSLPLRTKVMDADVTINHDFASTRLIMTFQNEYKNWKPEVEFLYTAPPNSVVTYFAYWYQGEKVVAHIVEKERAAYIYSTLTQWGVDPALIEMVGHNTFRARIFPIDVGQDLKIEMHLVQALPVDAQGTLFEFPLRQQQDEVAPSSDYNSWIGTPKTRGTYEKLRLHLNIKPDAGVRQLINNYNVPPMREHGSTHLTLSQLKFRPTMDFRMHLMRPVAPLHVGLNAAHPNKGDGYFALSLTPQSDLKNPVLNIRGVSTYDLMPVRLPALKAHQNFTVCGRYRGSGQARVLLRGDSPTGPQAYASDANFAPELASDSPATKLWAARKLDSLGVTEKNRARVIALSQSFNLPSKFTSWLAIPQAEMENYRRVEKQAKMYGLVRSLASEILQGREQSRTFRRLRQRIMVLRRNTPNDYGQDLNTEIAEALSGIAANLAQEWAGEELSVQPNRTRMKALRGQMEHAAQVTNRWNKQQHRPRGYYSLLKSSELITAERSELARNKLRELASTLVQERHRTQPDTTRMNRLQVELARISRVSGEKFHEYIQENEYEWTRNEMHQLAYHIVRDKNALQPDTAQIDILRAKLDHLAQVAGRRSEDFIYWQSYPGERDALKQLLSQMVEELRKDKPDTEKVQHLEDRFTALQPKVPTYGYYYNDKGPNPLEAAEVKAARTELKQLPDQLEELEKQGQSSAVEQLKQRRTQLLASLEKVETQYSRQGDPLISIGAPADAQQVIALMPGGEIKRLLFNAESGKWEARFDIPTYAAEGQYLITIMVVLKDGKRQQVQLHYKVDLTSPTGTGQASIVPSNKSMLRLELEGSDDTTRVFALLPAGEKVDLEPSATNAHHFSALVPLPVSAPGSADKVTFVLTDKAHNRTTMTVDMTQ
ncbi:MAG: hypothetical protein JO316_04165 [Abitibacteriaceae bacterium]|nr:hypothetical protein [Abditibacteriaceae bacterium]